MDKKNKKQLYFLKNTLKNPLTISYKGQGLVISPRQRLRRIDKAQLGALPKGLVLIPQN